jgi:multimeric flavodoxin WrbA
MSNLPVRLVGVSSSPRHGNTEALLNEALQAAKDAYPEITIEMISMKGKVIKPCLDCKACEKRRGDSLLDQCVQKDDWKEIVRPLVDPVPNGIILASPVYFSDVNAQMRAFMERFTSLSKPHWNKDLPFEVPDFSKTVGGALTVGFHRNGGQETTILNMLQFFTIQGMLSVGSVCPKYGSIGYYGGIAWEDAAGEQGRTAVKEDQWGLYSARVVGRNVARTALMLAKAPDVPVVVEPFVSPHGDAKTK